MNKIDMFKDEVYEEMDDISKLVEPIECDINNELSKFPDEVEVTKEDILNLWSNKYGWCGLDSSTIISETAVKLNINFENTYDIARKFFKFEVREWEEDDKVIINFETGELSHRLFLVKHTIGYDDKELESMARSNLTHEIKRQLRSNKSVNKSRLNEIADLFNANDVKSDRSYRGKVSKFCRHIDQLVADKKLDIRDLKLCNNFSKWIVLYVSEGNLAALNNITRIKIMMHENRPIYSIKERGVL